MRPLLGILLALAALTGLLGQQAAAARAVGTPPAAAATSMPADCAEMSRPTPSSREHPCKGITLDCIAATGCALPLAPEPAEIAGTALQLPSESFFQREVRLLAGSEIAPEPHPPSALG